MQIRRKKNSAVHASAKDAAAKAETPSLLEGIMRIMNESSPLQIIFEDLTGVVRDIPELRVSRSFRMHMCPFCRVVQLNPEAHLDCIRNKNATNRLATRRRQQFAGQCHLGVTDTVRPLVYGGRTLGIFYLGSVVLRGTEAEGRRKINRYCRRMNIDPAPILKQFDELPRLGKKDLSAANTRLDLVCNLTLRLVEASGIPIDRYRTEKGANVVRINQDMPLLVTQAMDYVHKNYMEPIQIPDIARQRRCHPDYLSRVFKKSVGYGLGEYIMRVRIDHARHLLHIPRYSVSEISFLVGFEEHSHFAKVFKRFVGDTPSRYRETLNLKDKPHPLAEERFSPGLSYLYKP